MKKHILNSIVLFLFWGCLYALFTKFWGVFKLNHHYYLKAFIVTAFLTSLSYKSLWSFGSDLSKSKKVKTTFSILMLFAFLTYSFFMFDRARGLYTFMISVQGKGRTGAYHQADKDVGHMQIPNARAFRTFSAGPPLPMAIDQDGFRVPLKDSLKLNTRNDIDVLFIGCSFTFGDACYADSIFTHLVSEELGYKYINAGVCAHGLSEMMVIANELIPKYKPKYTVIQHSPWLVDRAIELYGPADFGALTHAYISNTEAGGYQISPPLFKSQIFDLKPVEIREKYNNKFLQFSWDIILPFYLKEDYTNIKTLIDIHLLKKIPLPATDVDAVEDFAYESMVKLANENGSNPIIVKMGFRKETPQSKKQFNFPNLRVVDTDKNLNEYLATTASQDYGKEFQHWYNTGSKMLKIDYHPNNKAHAIIAKSIVEVMQDEKVDETVDDMAEESYSGLVNVLK